MLITPLGYRIAVRFARKPIWMPTAPSKLFRIAEHTFYDAEEIEQIKKLDVTHKAQLESIAKYMEKEFYIPASQAGGLPVDFIEKELEEDKKIYEENERINAEVAQRREKFFADRVRDLEEKVMEEKLAIEESLIEAGQKMDEYIRKTIEDPESFVTPDNLDTMIDKALENPVNFEFCIDRQGKKLGRVVASKDETNN